MVSYNISAILYYNNCHREQMTRIWNDIIWNIFNIFMWFWNGCFKIIRRHRKLILLFYVVYENQIPHFGAELLTESHDPNTSMTSPVVNEFNDIKFFHKFTRQFELKEDIATIIERKQYRERDKRPLKIYFILLL